jgi:hypothetical protein
MMVHESQQQAGKTEFDDPLLTGPWLSLFARTKAEDWRCDVMLWNI